MEVTWLRTNSSSYMKFRENCMNDNIIVNCDDVSKIEKRYERRCKLLANPTLPYVVTSFQLGILELPYDF